MSESAAWTTWALTIAEPAEVDGMESAELDGADPVFETRVCFGFLNLASFLTKAFIIVESWAVSTEQKEKSSQLHNQTSATK